MQVQRRHGDASPRPESERQRLFFALCPDDSLRANLARLARKLGRKRGRPVAAENLHVTLVFLGAVEHEMRVCAEQVAGRLRISPFTLRLDRLGHWPRPRVLWSGPSEMPAALLELVKQLTQGLLACGFAPDRRPYRAHVCLARKVGGRIGEVGHEPLEWNVRQFHLIESKTHAEGARYTVVASWPLHGPADV